ncbi:MAG: oligopeptide transporter, OPT family [Kiritimatiellae bacterium]|nr:oligopeptide transporter, OPT family [Kiritimatiellia bacterium]
MVTGGNGDTGQMKNREFTWTAFTLGIILSVVFGAANAYLGLRVGLTVSASVPAAVISMGVLRLILRRDSILENNMVQTIGSAGESLAAGAIFTMPALFLWAEEGICAPPGFWTLTVIALMGGILGVLLMVPLRRPLIVDEDASLIYPEGRACADVLKAGEEGMGRAQMVLFGLVGAVALKLVTDLLKWIPAAIRFPFRRLRGELGVEISSALFGVGYIVGPKTATLVFSGSFLGWMVLIPLFCAFSETSAATYAASGATGVWKESIRYVGAGAIMMGGLLSLLQSIPVFIQTFRRSRTDGDTGSERERDLPMNRVLIGIVCVILFLWIVPMVPVGFVGACLMALFGFFFATVSARMVGFVGSSNNPISGMTIATLVVAALTLKVTGTAGAAGMVSAIAIGSVVCIVAAMAGDMAQDLKTGYLLGATPWKQQVGELVGSVVAALTIGGVLYLLHKAWGFGSEQISAPQATLMKVIVEGIMGGNLPWKLLALGAGLALPLHFARVPVMPFAIGLYLSITLNMTIFLGGIFRLLMDRFRPAYTENGTLVSAGLIAGEGICGILLALLAFLKG